jgi:transcriptional regulator with XRE-family HTH domain
MRRGTPSAALFGDLLALIRTAGTAASMRQVGDKIGAPAATVSQVEKGQRALKAPKIAVWARALGVRESELLELWRLSQGEVLVGNRLTFYADAGEGLGTGALSTGILEVLGERPDLEPIYRLAELIAAVLRKVLPSAGVGVEPLHFEPLHVDDMAGAGRRLTAAQEDEQADHAAAFVQLPVIECYWNDSQARRPSEINARFLVPVPLLQEPMPIVRRRGKSVNTVELEDLIRSLSGPERERVRGYVEAIVEQRG